MPEVTVPVEDRPSIWKYVVVTAVGWVLVTGLVGGMAQNARSPAFSLLALAFAGVVNLTVLFASVELFVKAWFDAAVVAEG